MSETSQYRYCLIKPTEYFKNQFNLKRELLVIFSDFATLEPRTLDAFNYVYSRLPDLRVDKICTILISKDNNIEEGIRTILKSDLNMRSIIPFTYAELLNPLKDLIINRFRKYFYERDLFSQVEPITEEIFFFGRRDIVNKIYNRCIENNHSGIFGLRRSGKTSVLFAIKRLMEKNNNFYCYFDCQSLHQLRWNELTYHIVNEIIQKYNIQIPINKVDFNETETSQVFERIICQCIEKIKSKQIVLFFDEIEHLTFDISISKHWGDGSDYIKFWHVIRSYCQKYHNLSVLIAGTNPHMIESPLVESAIVKKYDNPMYQQITFEYLSPFDVNLTKEMINILGGYMGLKFDDIVCAELTQRFGGHPFLIRQYCSQINELAKEKQLTKPINITMAIYNEVKNKFDESKGNAYCQLILNVLEQHYKDEYDVLRDLALNNKEKIKGKLSDNQAITHLIGYGIIENNNNMFSFRIDLVKKYLCSKNKFFRLNLSLDEKWEEINSRRNTFEYKFRDIVRMQLKGNVGVEDAKKILSKLSSQIKKIVNSKKEYNDIFDDLTFSELITIVNKNWSFYKNLLGVDQQLFVQALYDLNKLRRISAHARNVDENEFQKFRRVMNYLESIIEKI